MLGNHGVGKTTLVKVIENEITNFTDLLIAGQWRSISESAAGIIPFSTESQRQGQILIYDMAGHYQCYLSHAALLKNL